MLSPPLLLLLTHFIAFTLSLPLNSPLLSEYDYIIIGAGPAGLTLANRLSEDEENTVLLLEAGPSDENEPTISVPGFIGAGIGGRYDWNLSTVPQVYLDGLPRNMPQGRALGGGTILNGMLWSRGGSGDYEDWVGLGNEGWGWDGADGLEYYMKKSERFTPPWLEGQSETGGEAENEEETVALASMAGRFGIQVLEEAHGYEGPVNVSFPRYFWNSSEVLFDALNELGVPTAYDPNTGGLVAGASFLPMNIDPTSQERCTARRAYYDPYSSRPNLWVSTGQTVTQILFADRDANADASMPIFGDESVGQGDSPGVASGIFGFTTTLNATEIDASGQSHKRGAFGALWKKMKRRMRRRQAPQPSSSGLIATGVEFAVNAGAPRQTVSATREVIVAAGALHSPQLLMLSGIGPAAALEDHGITVNDDLPGVGNNLQDHGQVWAWYPYYNDSYSNPTQLFNDEDFAAHAWDEYWTNRTGPLTTSAIAGVAFPSLPYIVNGSTDIANAALALDSSAYLPPGLDQTVLDGYARQHELLIAALQDVTKAAYELINANDGVLTIATMRPFSRGTVTLSSPRPFDPPIIDPRYGSNPVDVQVLQAALAFNRRLLETESLSRLEPIQIFPPADAPPAQLAQYINQRWQTEYHPAGTCAMMPLELGGVVSPELLVYGTRNLRVVDASIMPMLPAAHLQAVVYGVAEKAADIVKAANAWRDATPEPPAPYSMPDTGPIEEQSLAPSESTAYSAPDSTSVQQPSLEASVQSLQPDATSKSSFSEEMPLPTDTDGAAPVEIVTVIQTQTIYV